MNNLRRYLPVLHRSCHVSRLIAEILPDSDLICDLRYLLEAQFELLVHIFEESEFGETNMLDLMSNLVDLEKQLFALLKIKENTQNGKL